MTLSDQNFPQEILPRDGENALRRAKVAAQVIADHRGHDIVIMDLRTQTAAFDYFVIATGSSQRQLRTMCDAVDDVFQKELNDKKLGVEGQHTGRWMLLDYGDVLVHLFDEETRDYFRLEDLWSGGERVEFTPAE